MPNFNGCNTLEDVRRRHANQLTGEVLIQWSEAQTPETVREQRTPIFSVEANETHVIFNTEDERRNRIALAFPRLLTVLTSILEPGDIQWSADNFHTIYGIDSLNDEDFDTDQTIAAIFDNAQLPDNRSASAIL